MHDIFTRQNLFSAISKHKLLKIYEISLINMIITLFDNFIFFIKLYSEMMKNLSISKVQISIGNLYFIFLLITALFTRSFMGFRIFGFRLGELLVAFGLFSCILYVLSQVYNKKLSNKFFVIFSLFLIYFLIVIFLTNGSLVSLYTYKSSSFIWMIGYYF